MPGTGSRSCCCVTVIIYYGGQAWTRTHDLWLRHEALDQLTSHATRLAFDADYNTVLVTKARRDRLVRHATG